jgi:hypothetical protein
MPFVIERASLLKHDENLKFLAKSLYEHYKTIDERISKKKELGGGGNGLVLSGDVMFMKKSEPIESLVIIKTTKQRKGNQTSETKSSNRSESTERTDTYTSESVSDSIHYEFRVNDMLNALHPNIPNFPICFLFLKCYSDEPKKQLCSKSKQETAREYFIQERVTGVSLRNYIESTKDSVKWLSMLLQILVALQYAQDTIKFTHYDLHSSNVMIKTIENKENITLGLPYGDSTIYIPTFNHIPVIIDFGRSYVKGVVVPKNAEATLSLTFNKWFVYSSTTQRKGTDSNFFSSTYDLVEIGRSTFKKFPSTEKMDDDISLIGYQLLKNYGGVIDEDHENLPQNEEGPFREPKDLLEALLKTKLCARMYAAHTNPSFFDWKTKSFVTNVYNGINHNGINQHRSKK